MFVVNGKNTMPADTSNVEMWWHTHPNTILNGISLGHSTPSDADYSGQKTMTNRGYKGNTFVIGIRSGTITFFNKDGALTTVKWADFLRMGGRKNEKKLSKIPNFSRVTYQNFNMLKYRLLLALFSYLE